jgi:PKD repeat protein
MGKVVAVLLCLVVLAAWGGLAYGADFSATPLSGLAPLTVQFTDTSGSDASNWIWTFGDGAV